MTKKKVRKIKGTASVKGADPSKAVPSGQDRTDTVSEPELSGIAKLRQFFADVRAEFDKITWPSRKDTTALTIAVLSVTLFFSFYLGLVDIVLSKLVGLLIQ